MAEKKKSIIEESLLEFKTIEDALKANTKEILASTMKEEIEKVVRESLEEQAIEDNEAEDQDVDMEMSVDAEEAEETEDGLEDLELDMADADAEAEEMDDDEDAELELPMDDMEGEEPEMELGDAEGMLASLGDMEMDMDGEEPEMDMDMEDELDLTMASDDEVLKVFKKMGDEDEIEVVKDEEGISLKDNQTGAEYYIKESDELNEDEMCEGAGCSEMSEEEMEEETIYEVELDEEMYEAYMDESKEMEEGEEISEEEVAEGDEMKEEEEPIEEDKMQRHQKSGKQRYSGAKAGSDQLGESRKSRRPSNVRKESYEKLLKEYDELKSKNGEYKEALKVFKTKINEVALFNQNLAHVTKLFTEHSTTKKEKMAILGRFDEIETIKESKSLYKNIAGELTEKAPITESVDKKVNKTIDSSKSNLNESTAYVDPQINKIKDLMSRINS
tara:strand:+ start:1824 stop:3161 length:1338 start_codon:yes stop_codon:yes gene_type:complete